MSSKKENSNSKKFGLGKHLFLSEDGSIQLGSDKVIEEFKKPKIKKIVKTQSDVNWLKEKSNIAYHLLVFILDNLPQDGFFICSYRVFEERFGISQASVTRAIKLLKENGFINIFKSGTTNVYSLNYSLTLSTFDNGRKYSAFSSIVFLSYSENYN